MKLTFAGIENIPMIEPGDDLVAVTLAGLASMGETLKENDVLVYAQKIISKAEDRYLDLRTVTPGPEAQALAKKVDKDPRKVQAILDESRQVLRAAPGVLIVEQRNGFIQANAGIDQSNIPFNRGEDKSGEIDDICLLLPLDPDRSAAQIREAIYRELNIRVGVIINDSLGRAWRLGTLGLAIGVAGMTALENHIGDLDLYGRELEVTEVAAADEMAAGASLVMGQTTGKTPIVLVRGYAPVDPEDAGQRGIGPLLRPAKMDLFR